MKHLIESKISQLQKISEQWYIQVACINKLNPFRIASYYIALGMLFLTFTSCEESDLIGAQKQSTLGVIEGEASTSRLDEKTNGPSTPYPTILRQTFVPGSSLVDHTKCLTWRISWPEYAAGYDHNLIPTVMTLTAGQLNSFNYLNQSSPQTTYASTLSLYHDNKVQGTAGMWMELDYADVGEAEEFVFFKEVNYSVSTIQNLVTQRPDLWDNKWIDTPKTPIAEEITYQEGDVFLFKLDRAGYYGGIRIVSMTPRIIEVYLAVPNIGNVAPQIETELAH